MKHAACPDCGAKTEKQAVAKCKPKRCYNGEYECTGMYMHTDAEGWFTYPPKADQPQRQAQE